MYWTALMLWFAFCFAVAALGGWLTASEIAGWYRTLRRPVWAPPTWVYGPVWTLLYALMAVAAWQVWLTAPSLIRSRGLILFVIQLGLNLAWSWMFFHEHEIGAALADLIVLCVVVGITTLVFAEVAHTAAWLMVPYWAWLSFAAILNAAFWRQNR